MFWIGKFACFATFRAFIVPILVSKKTTTTYCPNLNTVIRQMIKVKINYEKRHMYNWKCVRYYVHVYLHTHAQLKASTSSTKGVNMLK